MKAKKHIVYYPGYYPGTKKKYGEYYELNDKRHREDGPASICYYESGNIECEYYYINGKSHREDNPAVIYYYENGNIKREYYYINDKKLTKQEFDKYKRKRHLK